MWNSLWGLNHPIVYIKYVAALPSDHYAFPCVFVRGTSYVVWEQVLTLYRKHMRNNKSAGGGGVFGERRKWKNTLYFSFSQQTPSPCSSSPKSAQWLSSTDRALQSGTTTNSASLTSHGKHSCLSVFACGPFPPPLCPRPKTCSETEG